MQEWAGARVELIQNIAAGVTLALVSALPTALQKYLPGIVAFPVESLALAAESAAEEVGETIF